jgi:hypothetical protein
MEWVVCLTVKAEKQNWKPPLLPIWMRLPQKVSVDYPIP